MTFIGDNIKIPCGTPLANDVNADEWYCESTGEISRNFTVKCPCCGKNNMPFRSKKNKSTYRGTTYPWCGCDHQDVLQHFTKKCGSCAKIFQYGIFSPQ